MILFFITILSYQYIVTLGIDNGSDMYRCMYRLAEFTSESFINLGQHVSKGL